MITKESLLFHGIESSSRSGGLLSVTRRNALLKAAFLLGNRGEKREIIAAIRGAAEIPPAVKWDAETIKDCVANYYFENNRYPRVFDLCLLNCLPTAEAIKYVFGVSAQRWLDGYRCFVVGFESEAASGQGTGKRTKKKIARVTRKQALLAAESVLEGEEKERVREMIAEYPIAEWNERNVADVLISFYEKYGRVPAEREMKNSCELPYYGIFRYRFHMTYRAFLRKFLPPLYEILCGSANERNNAEISGAVSGAAKKQGAKSAERKRKSETKKGEPKRGKTKSGKIKSIKIIRLDFGGSVFYPTFSNVQDYYFWEEEKKYKDTFILDYFLNKSARNATGETLPDNALKNAPAADTDNAPGNDTDNAPGKAMKNAPGNDTDNAPDNARKVARHGKPVGSRFAAWEQAWEIAQKTARLAEKENALKNTLKNTPPDDEILALSDVPTGNPPFDPIGDPPFDPTGVPTGVPIGDPTGGRRNFRGNAR
ncbi:MAG: hypothetical protein KID07_06010 [Firmicutes bacterium]|nr:hypothetical protein [Bacillota bacterium]